MPQGEKVTDKSFIFMLLKRLEQKKTGVEVTIPRQQGTCSSTLLGINTEEPESLVFDEMNLPEAQQRLQKSRIMEVSANLKGVKIRMQCHLKEVDTSEEVVRNIVTFPYHIWYYQQRDTYRVHIGDDLKFSARLKFRTSDWIDARLTDVSHTGLGIVIDQYVPFENGEIVKMCELTLPTSEVVLCKVVIRHVFHDDQRSQTQLGVKIIQLDGQERKLYVKAIHDAQREMLRRHARVANEN